MEKLETLQTDTSYLGLRLPHPFIAGASPFGYYLDTIKRLEDAGCAAVVLHSLFEEQTSSAAARHPEHMNGLDRQFGETVAHFPPPGDYPLTPDAYAEHISRAKSAVRIPIIASFNGSTGQSWLRLVQIIEQAGADALELNFYDVVTSLTRTGAAVEDEIVATVRELKGAMTIPLAVKVPPYFASFGNLAKELEAAGADGLVLFNRLYQPDIDIKTIEPFVNLRLSTNAELRLRLQWVAILHGRVRPSLALTGGVETPDDGIKAVLAGADVVQLVSALLRHGPEHIGLMRRGLERWMERQKFSRLDEARGRCSLDRMGDPTAFDRGNYIRTLHSWIRT
ncbi:MAG: dihydroorotate dehydrogenase-like protein [Vicinamibacterales bacterium]|nr:dihydroorotate dehydrogenase-like protein [Vicinamibacterales bacterium]